MTDDRVNILLVDDRPGKLLSYEVVLRDLGENLLQASSAREALEHLLKSEIAVILIDVCMPDLDGFQLASMIREHPRFQQIAIIFVSAIQVEEVDFLRGYQMGAVDYVPVPVIPDVLRAKVKVFAELYRKTRQLEKLNVELESRVRERTAELEASTARLLESERRRNMALAAGNMGSFDWDILKGDWMWDEGHCRIFGVDPRTFKPTLENVAPLVHPEDMHRLREMFAAFTGGSQSFQTELRVIRPDGELRWCFGTAAPALDDQGRIVRVSGVTIDITERKQAEERQFLLAREVDHRAKNALAVVQSIVRLSRSDKVSDYISLVEGRIRAVARAHTLLAQSRWQGADLRRLVDEELDAYRTGNPQRITLTGPDVSLEPSKAQTIALALHELVTNAAKHGALSSDAGRVQLSWQSGPDELAIHWAESGGPAVQSPAARGFGLKVIASSIEGQLGGTARFDWAAGGLRCSLNIPHRPGEQPSARKSSPSFIPNGVQLDGAAAESQLCVMLVEDEPLVGMMLKDMLGDLGVSIIGPFTSVAEALPAAGEANVDFAILDINLAGEWVYPVAEVLAGRSVPFVFVTGYSKEFLDRRFADIPVYEKPIEAQLLLNVLGTSQDNMRRSAARNARRAALGS
jgi:PAS domain S-box-containing protein